MISHNRGWYFELILGCSIDRVEKIEKKFGTGVAQVKVKRGKVNGIIIEQNKMMLEKNQDRF